MRIGVAGFQSQRLVQARTVRGLTQTALSAISGCSNASLSKWERGEQLPELAALEKVAAALGMPTAWFLKPLPDYGDTSYFFRSSIALTKEARNVAEGRLKWAYELSQVIQEWVGWPTLNLPDSLSRKEALSLTDEEIEALAVTCRQHWHLGLGPIDDVIRIVEGSGVLTVREPLGYIKMDGVSHWFEPEGRPYIFIAADKASAVRNRFDVAHELGHLIMHHYLTPADNTRLYHELERQAHLFASAFLMPADSISVELACPTLDTLLVLKRRWKTSIAAMIMRAKSLNLLDDAYTTRLWKNYSARGWKRSEPLDDELQPELPRLLPRAIKLLLEEGGFSKAQLLSTIGLPASDVEALCQLSEGYLRENFGAIIQLNIPTLRKRDHLSGNRSTSTRSDTSNVISMPVR
ncbi:helix-turn-helix domain-containing protein [Thiothrix fructosivorans]|uniref:ImmA/IrrE family metallo-endopeptidase n=1 Tax=Thiothrix fructosivorans TaxID=111770 RepID=A0A8B0SM64_9GAMM|nr:XRE family transcriptional regulator [Thiothrix fructosivorans]MBO0612545.1 ImmA/IrrE family metallo-endopeptidase [Thiothrix fructosivorans]QTX11979.1 ImmA/IrrE family metallo-endopeptidase [Thiothrix fructosivorans]